MERAPIKCNCGCGRDLRPKLEHLLAAIEAGERRVATDEMNQMSAEAVSGFDAADCITTLELAAAAGNAQHPTKYHLLLTALVMPAVHAVIAARIRQIHGQPAPAEGVRR